MPISKVLSHTCTSRWSNGGGKFSTRKIFKKFLGGWKIFPFRFLVNFDVFLVDFDAKTHMRGENLPKIPNGGWKITTRTTPQRRGEKILGIFQGGKNFFPFHVLVACPCMNAVQPIRLVKRDPISKEQVECPFQVKFFMYAK